MSSSKKEERRAYQKKMEWVASLHVGDTVEDCRYEVCTIKEIREERFAPRWLTAPFWLYRILPQFLKNYLSVWEDFLASSRLGKLSDKTLTLHDGRMCSAFYCCDPKVY